MTKASSRMSPHQRRKDFRKAAVVLLVVAATFGGLALLGQKLGRRERDWYAILDQVVEIETRLRAGDASVWSLFESGHPSGSPNGGRGGARLAQDMERLASLEDLRLQDVHVDVRGDTAEATYRLGGGPPHGGEPRPPGGRFAFRRAGDSWKPEGHTFIDAGPASRRGSGEEWRRGATAHRHLDSHQRLAIRLTAIAGLALLASLACAAWPWFEVRFAARPRDTVSRVGKKFR